MPITQNVLGRLPIPDDVLAAHNVGDHERQKAEIKEKLLAYLSRQPLDEHGRITLTDFEQSDMFYSVDPRAIVDWRDFKFSTEVQYAHANGSPTVETFLNRPLRGVPRLPCEMLWKLDLVSEATKDFNGRCAAHQLLTAVTMRSQVGGNRRNARPLFASIEDVEAVLDDLEFELYPGRYEGPPPPDLPEAKRELEPYVELWRGYIPPQRPRELFECQRSSTRPA